MATDVDFLLVEHHVGMPVALVEYKHWRAQPVNLDHPSYLALAALADRAPAIPFIVARYWPDTWAFRVTPANLAASRWFDGTTDLSEAEWVDIMHRMRAVTVQQAVGRNLNRQRPPAAA